LKSIIETSYYKKSIIEEIKERHNKLNFQIRNNRETTANVLSRCMRIYDLRLF
jgi:hypothetical protein